MLVVAVLRASFRRRVDRSSEFGANYKYLDRSGLIWTVIAYVFAGIVVFAGVSADVRASVCVC